MAGGAGTRFWPRSRVHTPKQLLALRGGRSLLQETVARVSPPVRRDHVLVVTARAQARAVARQLARRGRGALLVEPEGRNTAAAIALAALHVARRAPEAVLAGLPADHLIDDLPAFLRGLRLALQGAAQSGWRSCAPAFAGAMWGAGQRWRRSGRAGTGATRSAGAPSPSTAAAAWSTAPSGWSPCSGWRTWSWSIPPTRSSSATRIAPRTCAWW